MCVLLFDKEISDRLKMYLGVTGGPCSLLHNFICPVTIFLLGFNSLLFLIIENHYFFNLPLTMIITLILIARAKSNILFTLPNQFTKSLLAGTFKILLTNFIYYFTIKNFYDVNLINIYKLLYSKLYISNRTMTGITTMTPDPNNPCMPNFNLSTNSYIECNHFSLYTTQTYSWVVKLFIMVLSVLIFAILMYLNFKIYFKKSNKSKLPFEKTK